MRDNYIKTLIRILEESNINELEITTFWGRQKIRLAKSPQLKHQNIDTIISTPDKIPAEDNYLNFKHPSNKVDGVIEPESPQNILEKESEIQAKNTITIKAPLVGTFYRSAKPESPPFISEGDVIEEGQIICIIEAMKIFNEIESEYSGKVIKILLDDTTPVEYDQDLLVISTK